MKVFSNESKKTHKKHLFLKFFHGGDTEKSTRLICDKAVSKRTPSKSCNKIQSQLTESHPEINKQQRLLVNISINKAKHARQNYKKRLNACKQFVKNKTKRLRYNASH